MNVGQLSPVNSNFLKEYKKAGYTTKTGLIDDAVTLLRQQKEAQTRRRRLEEAAKSYRENAVWQDLDGEDYAD